MELSRLPVLGWGGAFNNQTPFRAQDQGQRGARRRSTHPCRLTPTQTGQTPRLVCSKAVHPLPMHSEQNPSSSSSLQGPTLSPHRIPLSTLCLATPRPLRPPARPHVTAQLLQQSYEAPSYSGPQHSRFSFWNDFSRMVIFSPVTLVSPRQSRARGAFPVYRLRVALPARHPLSPSIFCCLCPHRHPAFTASARVSRWPAGQGRGADCSLTSGPSVPSWGPAVSRAGRVSAE